MLFLLALFFGILAPLLPKLAAEGDLSTSQTGLLVAMLGGGAVVGTLAGASLAMRIGVRRTALGAMALLAGASLVFGLARSYQLLLVARFLQGAGDYGCGTASLSWLFESVPVAKRGETLGIVLSASAGGAIIGPVFGGLASAVGRVPVFFGLAAMIALVAPTVMLVPAPPHSVSRRLRLGSAWRAPRVRQATWPNILPPMLLSAMAVLVPLQLHGLGAGAGAIAASFGIAAVLGALLRPLVGRWSDRRGRLQPIAWGLFVMLPFLVATPWLVSLSLVVPVVVVALILAGLLWTPLMAMVSDACAQVGVTQFAAVALINLVGSVASIIGSAGAGGIAQLAGQRAAYAAMGATVLATLIALMRGRETLARGARSARDPG